MSQSQTHGLHLHLLPSQTPITSFKSQYPLHLGTPFHLGRAIGPSSPSSSTSPSLLPLHHPVGHLLQASAPNSRYTTPASSTHLPTTSSLAGSTFPPPQQYSLASASPPPCLSYRPHHLGRASTPPQPPLPTTTSTNPWSITTLNSLAVGSIKPLPPPPWPAITKIGHSNSKLPHRPPITEYYLLPRLLLGGSSSVFPNTQAQPNHQEPPLSSVDPLSP